MRQVLFVALLTFLPTVQAEPLPAVQVTAGMYVVRAELAADFPTRMQGLMYRKSLAPNAGMLFVFDELAGHCMWMKNTFIPLSVAFVDPAGVITNIADMTPHSEESHCATRPALFALEMEQGWFAKRGIKAGMKLGGLEKFQSRR